MHHWIVSPWIMHRELVQPNISPGKLLINNIHEMVPKTLPRVTKLMNDA